jgi:zinc transport system substrate-binding protein
MMEHWRWLTVPVMVTLLPIGCGGDEPAAADGKLQVVASFYPLAELGTKVGGPSVEVTNLTPAGTEPHDLEITSGQVDRIEDADVVLYLGDDFQPAVEEVARRAEGGVDLLEGVALHESDPHVWLDPVLMGDLVEATRSALAARAPERAEEFAGNAAAYRRELSTLADEYATGMAPCRGRVLVASHEAYGYLVRRYGLEQEAVTGISPEAEPSPERLAALADIVRRRGVTTIFTEELVSPRVAEALAREAGVGVAELSPLEGLSQEDLDRGENYVSVMRRNLDVLRQGLGC